MIKALKLYTGAALILSTLFLGMKNHEPKKGVLITVHEEAKRIDISVNGKSFTSYIYPETLKKPVLYPILTPSGKPVTRGWPLDPRPGERVDHPHHVGLWFNYGDVNGHDFWNNSNNISSSHKGPFGTIRHRSVDKVVNGRNKAELGVSMDWLSSMNTAIIREKTTYIFSCKGEQRIIDRITTLTALEDINFKDNKEGMFAMRIARQLEQPYNKAEKLIDSNGNISTEAVLNNEGVSGKYYSSEGKNGDAVWGTRAKWVMLNGMIDNEPVTLAIMDHPSNLGYPGGWHARGYGLFGVNAFGKKSMGNSSEEFNYILPKGKSITFKHRLLIHSGSSVSQEEVEKEFTAFAKN